MTKVWSIALLFCAALVVQADDSGYKFKGTVQVLPSTAGLIGNWMVAGRTVIVTPATELDGGSSAFAVGRCVQVKGLETPAGIQAREIESEDQDECTQSSSDLRFYGSLERLPASGLVGEWLVGSRAVLVTNATVIDQGRGPLSIGSCLEITGQPMSGNVIAATRIDVTSGNGGCRSAIGSGNSEIDFRGVVQTMQSSVWLVSGRILSITGSTRILPNGRRTEVGDCVDVDGTLRSDGTIVATRIQRLGGGACRELSGPPVEPVLIGLVQSLPASGLIGDWRVSSQTVRVTSMTSLDTDRGPVNVGSCVEVRGTHSGGIIDAAHIETLDPSRCTNRETARFRLSGILESIPPGGRAGIWTISGRTVTADNNTVIDTSRGAAVIGACVEADGTIGTGNTLLASRIQVQSASGVCLVPGGVVNAGSLSSLGVAPGLIVSLYGFNIGPATQLPLQIAGGNVTNQLGRTRVLFDGVPATLLFASQWQVNAIVPCSVAGRTQTVVQIESNGAWSNPITLPVSPATPSLFTTSGGGTGQGAILNQNYSLNGPSQPAARGSVAILYGTGFGQTTPACTDGTITPVLGPFPRPNLPVTVTIGGKQATVQYVGAAPGLVTGVVQINAVVPSDVQPGSAVPVVVKVGDRNSQSGVTMAVQ